MPVSPDRLRATRWCAIHDLDDDAAHSLEIMLRAEVEAHDSTMRAMQAAIQTAQSYAGDLEKARGELAEAKKQYALGVEVHDTIIVELRTELSEARGRIEAATRATDDLGVRLTMLEMRGIIGADELVAACRTIADALSPPPPQPETKEPT